MRLLILFTLLHLAFAQENTDNKTDTATKNIICTVCNCDRPSKTVDCSGRKINKLFTRDEWLALNSSGEAIDNIRFDLNEITNITPFPAMKIKFLSFKQNEISNISPLAFKNLTELEELDLSYNSLSYDTLSPNIFEGKYDPDEYEPLKKFKILKLGNNKIHSLDPDLFEHLPNLESLSLDSNPFMIFDSVTVVALSNIPKLKFLDLSYMELNDIPEHLFHRPRQLETLNLTGNLFTKIPDAIKYAINIKYLSLDENIIPHFNKSNALPHLEKLEILSISYMPVLKSIEEEALGHLPALHTLYCTNNPHLSYINSMALSRPGDEDPDRREWPMVKYLYLHNNNLTAIEGNLLSRWDVIEVADIRHNPWKCDCSTQWMISNLMPIIIEKTPQISGDNYCMHPIEMVNKQLITLADKGSHMRCEDYYGHRPEKDGAILVGILAGLLIGIPLSFGLIVIYKRGCFGLSGASGPADYSRAFYKRAHTHENFYI